MHARAMTSHGVLSDPRWHIRRGMALNVRHLTGRVRVLQISIEFRPAHRGCVTCHQDRRRTRPVCETAACAERSALVD